METKREHGANESSTAESLVNNDVHLFYMREALDEARKCTPVPTAFCVGCIIVIPADETNVLKAENEDNRSAPTFSPAISIRSKGLVFATGYSRELPGNTHAEANALSKARQLTSLPSTLSVPPLSSGADAEVNPQPLSEQDISDLLAQSSIYTTLEPCSVRTSGRAPCVNAILDAKIKKCYIGAPEPPDFVTCEGAKILRDAGVEIVWVKGLGEECLSVARGVF
jgi:pyrimidine deaminase RibD-like protein